VSDLLTGVDWRTRSAAPLLALYPLFAALVWTSFSLVYYWRREARSADETPSGPTPKVGVLIPAFNEAATIGETIDRVLELDYPDFEVIVVNDGSPDDHVERVRPFLSDRRVRLLDKTVNEGKSLALNDAAVIATGDVLVVVDADTRLRPDALRRLARRFADPQIAAVTGNPFIRGTGELLVGMQAAEFASVVGGRGLRPDRDRALDLEKLRARPVAGVPEFDRLRPRHLADDVADLDPVHRAGAHPRPPQVRQRPLGDILRASPERDGSGLRPVIAGNRGAQI
jgi:cellulose synthase/poly-beta-1,6-N-acetylglucosamine synthase-like glycosyltransferase